MVSRYAKEFLMIEILKSDWKLYREKIGGWQENYMEKLIAEYTDLLRAEDKKASDKFWELEKRIKNDRRHPGVIIEMKRSNAIYGMVNLVRSGVITCDDLIDFSDDLQQAVAFMVERFK